MIRLVEIFAASALWTLFVAATEYCRRRRLRRDLKRIGAELRIARLDHFGGNGKEPVAPAEE